MLAISVALMMVAAIVVAWLMGANSISPSFAPPASLGNVGVLRGALLAGLFAFFGAVLQGGNVAETVGSGLLSGMEISPFMGGVILIISAILIGIGIYFKVPIPAVFTVVGSVIGAGVASGATVNIAKVKLLGTMWIVAPFAGITMGLLLSKMLRRFVKRSEKSKRRLEIALLIIAAFAAYAGGSNRVGLAIGVVSGGSGLSLQALLFMGGGFILAGSLIGGPRILGTVSRDYSELGIRRAVSALASVAVIIQIATILGVPVSTNEVLLGAIIGSGLAAGSERIRLRKMGETAGAWIITLFGSVLITWSIVTYLVPVL